MYLGEIKVIPTNQFANIEMIKYYNIINLIATSGVLLEEGYMNKKVVNLIVAGTFVATALSACGNTANTTSSDATSIAAGTESTASGSEAASGSAVSGGSEEEGQSAETTGKTEFWNDKLASTDSSLVDELQQSISGLSGIDVSMVSYPDVASYRTALQQSINSSDAPGMFTWWSGSDLTDLYNAGVIEDLTDMWNEYFIPAGVPENVAGSLSFDGKYYASPYSIIYNSMLYNKATFEKYGVEEPATYDEFLDVCKTLKDNGVTPLGTSDSVWGFKYFQVWLAIYDVNLYDGVCDGSIPFNDSRVKEACEEWERLIKLGYFSEPMGEDLNKAIATGEIAMTYDFDSAVRSYAEEYGTDVGAFVIPPKDPAAKKVVFFEISPICIAKNSADKESAKEVLKSWYSQENQEVFTKVTKYHCINGVKSDYETANEMMGYAADTDNYELRLRFYENLYNSELRDYALDQFMKFEMGDVSADDMLDDIAAKAEELK